LDYRKFLKSTAESELVVLPYFGGTRVDAETRSFEVATTTAPVVGWWRFRVEKRTAVPVERVDPPDLSKLPALRGHYSHGWVIASGKERGRIAIEPTDDPAPLSRVTARRWYSGEYLLDSVDFEDEAEQLAREMLEKREPLRAIKGVAPSLRVAYGYALGMEAARSLEIPMSVAELSPIAVMIADQGVEVVRQLFEDLVEERRRAVELARLAEEARRERERLSGVVRSARGVARPQDPRTRIDQVLRQASARMLSVRRAGQNIDVTYEVDGNRIISLCDVDSLQIIDPGVCLAGAHRVLTLDAMPSVIREAIEEDHLNITRRS
jgi:hypothetical protein